MPKDQRIYLDDLVRDRCFGGYLRRVLVVFVKDYKAQLLLFHVCLQVFPGLGTRTWLTSAVLCWVIQIQLLPQIIINRIRIILQDRGRGRRLIIGAAIYVTLINISVFIIWIPARLQISPRCV